MKTFTNHKNNNEQRTTNNEQPRRGFTIVEMLIVTAIFLILASMVIGLVPKARESQKVLYAANQVQGWVILARQWALRDRAPRGIRLIVPVDGLVKTLQYIEQPDDWTTGTTTSVRIDDVTTDVTNIAVTTTGIDFSGGFGGTYATTGSYWPIQVGDYFEIGVGSASKMAKIKLPITTDSLTLDGTNCGMKIYAPTSNYRIVRAPRVRLGEPDLKLSTDVVIDTAISNRPTSTYPSPLPGGAFTGAGKVDIMFSPAGQLIGEGIRNCAVRLWVRDASLQQVYDPTAPAFRGEQRLVCIKPRSGIVATHPVDSRTNLFGVAYFIPYHLENMNVTDAGLSN